MSVNNNSINSNLSNSSGDPGKDYLSPAFFLLRKYVKEKRYEIQKVEREDGPIVDKNCFLMKLVGDTLQLLTDLDANIAGFEMKFKSGHKKIDEKIKLIHNQRSLLRSQPNRLNNNHNGQDIISSTSNHHPLPDRINISTSTDSQNTYHRYLPDDITIERLPRSPLTLDQRNQSQAHNHTYVRPQSTNVPPPPLQFSGGPPIVMRLGIPKNNSPNSFRVIDSTIRPFLDDRPNSPRLKPDFPKTENLTQCPFCPSARYFNSKSTMMRHFNDDHPEHLSVYNDIFSLTPESYVSNSNTISGTSQCFYCSVLFRSKAPLLRHIQEEHPDKYSVFETVANFKGVKLKNLITRPTIAQNSSVGKPDGLMIFNHVLSTSDLSALNNINPNVINVNATVTTASNVINVPGQIAAKFATNSTTSVQQRYPHHAAKSCQSATITTSNIVQPTKKVVCSSIPDPIPISPVKQITPVVSPIKKTMVSGENSRGRSDHEYSNTNLKRPAMDTKSPTTSPIRKTKKQQAEAIKSRYPCPKCRSHFSSMNALTLHSGFYCVARTKEEKAAVEGLKPCLPSSPINSSSEGRIFIPPEKREEVARAVSPALSRASASSRASNGQVLCNNSSDSISEDIVDDESLRDTIREFTIELVEMTQIEKLECLKSERTKKLLNLNCK